MHPQKQGSCSSTSGISLATWYAARVFASLNMVGERTPSLFDSCVAVTVSLLVPCNEYQAMPAIIATAMTPRTTFCLLVDFNDSPLIIQRRNNRFQQKEYFSLFFVG